MTDDLNKLRELSESLLDPDLAIWLFEESANAVLVVRDGAIFILNKKAEALFGYSRKELYDSPIETLVPDDKKLVHPAYRDKFVIDGNARPMGLGISLKGRRKDGDEFDAEIDLSAPKVTERGTFVSATVRKKR